MSILDGKVTLSDNRQQSNNKGNGNSNNDRKERNNNTRRRYYNDDEVGLKSSYLPDGAEEAKPKKRDERAEKILQFCDKFSESTSDFKGMQDLVIDELPGIIHYVNGYYNNKISDEMIDALNKLIAVFATTQFTNALHSILNSGAWIDDGVYDKIWSDIAFAISIVLETSHAKMHDDAISKYVVDILPRMWKPEITQMIRDTGITKDLALDLTIAIPMMGIEWTGANIDAFCGRFLEMMLRHAEDNMDVLNYEVQGVLYKMFFGDQKTALKIIGKYLTKDAKTEFGSDVEEAVYKEFNKMIYTALDKYDIKDIAYVFRFVAKFRKENPDKKVMFSLDIATEYDNVKKGILQVMDEDSEYMKYLG